MQELLYAYMSVEMYNLLKDHASGLVTSSVDRSLAVLLQVKQNTHTKHAGVLLKCMNTKVRNFNTVDHLP